MSADEIASAITTICVSSTLKEKIDDAAFATLHEGLLQPNFVVADLRRASMLLSAPAVDSSEADEQKATSDCGPGYRMLARTLINRKTLQTCVDAVALSRDEHLAGDLSDAPLAGASLMLASEVCSKVMDEAPREDVARVATILTALRATFPANLDEVARRDREEMILFTYGALRAPAQPFACKRAERISRYSASATSTRSQRVEVVEHWQKHSVPVVAEAYEERYRTHLARLDSLIEHAKKLATQ